MVHSAVDLYEPEIGIDKTVAPAGPVSAGDEVTWTLSITNEGIDPIRRAVVTDPLPAGLTYIPGSVRFTAGGPSGILGPKSDAAGDDQADWHAATRTLTLRVGAGADASTGGTMGIAPAPDGSDAVRVTFRTRVDGPPDRTTTNTAHAHGEGRRLDDPFGPLVTDDHDPAEISAAPESDLGITKTDGDATVRAVGDRYPYRLRATNAGPSPATGVVLTDRLDPHVRFVDSDDGCTAADRQVTCPIGDLAAGRSVDRTFLVEVVELPGAGEAIPNTARITGDQPDPDCTGPTPAPSATTTTNGPRSRRSTSASRRATAAPWSAAWGTSSPTGSRSPTPDRTTPPAW
ncbi:isopeptide-forming domain-containing fimbrial protein [Aquihabitans daechungensis]|uniref:isopeptide-forming domain-containing fimbrial protein n=1 Tax=Aquihabitans daechungensis TaxID=1052257 RepID=UPI003BA3B03D